LLVRCVVASYKELWSSDVCWYSLLEASQWLMHVSSVLSAADAVVGDFVDTGRSVILRGLFMFKSLLLLVTVCDDDELMKSMFTCSYSILTTCSVKHFHPQVTMENDTQDSTL